MDISIILALFVGFLWGLAPIVHKILLKNIDFKLFMVLSSCCFFACTCIFAIYFWKDLVVSAKKQLTIFNLSWIILASVFVGFIANLVYLFVLKDYKSYIVSALIYCSPFFTLALSYLFLKENITYVGASGCILITLGVILIALGS